MECRSKEEEQQLTISKRLLGMGASAAIIFAACGPGAPTTAPVVTQGPAATTAPVVTTAPATQAAKYIACVAFDTGGLGDKGFNDLAQKGLADAKTAGYETFEAEAQSSTDYAANVQRLIDKGCQTIVTVGFNQGAATAEKAIANPSVAFADRKSVV